MTKFRTPTVSSGADVVDHIDYENFRHVCHKWHFKLTKSMVKSLDSDSYVRIRNGLIVLDRVRFLQRTFAIFSQKAHLLNIRQTFAIFSQKAHSLDIRQTFAIFSQKARSLNIHRPFAILFTKSTFTERSPFFLRHFCHEKLPSRRFFRTIPLYRTSTSPSRNACNSWWTLRKWNVRICIPWHTGVCFPLKFFFLQKSAGVFYLYNSLINFPIENFL